MLPVNNTSWGSGDYSVLTNLTEEECLQACLNDCMCVVVTHGVLPTVGDAACYMKMLPMTDGRQGADITTRSFVKVAGDILPPSGKQRKRRIAVELPQENSIVSAKLTTRESKVVEGWKEYSYTEIETITDFSRVLGNGAFGTVFEGSLPNERANEGSVPDERAGAMKVAVKKLHVQEAQAENERSDFETEMKAIGTSHHKNLVRLYGFCKEGPHRFLVYEFMCKGSLGKVLFRGSVFLDWRVRVQIAKGIARGIRYLHQGYGPQILHIDIKPQNILLGQNYNPKICDFGIAKLFTAEQTHHTLTSARGTTDYMAPELLNGEQCYC
ncbi:G-type lectin S-receptor-like serine/threonine-protein kinase LECRK4 [Cryptomeria japonica]|uniref:G-type lectin S-receptor-like serine/threonine-protein kinase LECRK4 n=1 Tax=Cryptomeria japonica TaxID=3369 RepID=UPI0027DA77B2|nr:G-type lectin S-receptor-like serine/threonine-protein kinase LECRK4 [Cryptomeria japonica]